MVPLSWTGERFLPGVGPEIAHYHYGRYLFATQLCRGKTVIDIPSGEGFGSAILADSAKFVIGMDISEEAVSHATEKYRRTNLRFEVGDLAHIPLNDGEVGGVVCLEGIEHVDEETQAQALSEFARILAPDGILIISSPNRYVYSDLPGTENAYHVHEFYTQEFRDFLETRFRHSYFFGQNLQDGSILFPIGTRSETCVTFLTPSPIGTDEFTDVASDPDEFKYQIAVCSQQEIESTQLNGFVTVDVRQQISALRDLARQKEIGGLGVERDALLVERDALLAGADALRVERDALRVERDALLVERDALLVERCAKLKEHDRDQFHAARRLRNLIGKVPFAGPVARRLLHGLRRLEVRTRTRRPRS